MKFAEGKGSYKAFVEFNTFECFSVDVNTRKSGFTHAHLCLECLSVDAEQENMESRMRFCAFSLMPIQEKADSRMRFHALSAFLLMPLKAKVD